MKRGLFLFAVVLLVQQISVCRSKKYTRCGITNELVRRNFPRSFIGHWVCLIESESGKDTSKITNKSDGSKNLGIFQINNKEYCTYKKKGGKCNMKCEDLIDENLVDDSGCAKMIYNQKGFQAWNGWVRGCYGRDWPMPVC